MQLIPTIISGGVGARLWPVSRVGEPKPFMRIGNGGSLLQQTFKRAAALPGVSEILTVTGHELYARMQAEYQDINTKCLRIPFILEPVGRNTAAAVAVAALHCVRAYGEDAVMLVLPADHLIDHQQAFADAVAQAISKAEQGKLAIFGIEPTSAHTGYGYIDVSAEPIRFIEKPPQGKAEEFFRSGHHLWNSGMFCFKSGILLQEMKTHCPSTVDAAEFCMANSPALERQGAPCVNLESDSFSRIPNSSFDVAVMEKTRNIAVVPGHFGWRDIGSWAAVADLSQRDANGNAGSANTQFHQSSNCYVHGGTRPVAVVGLENIIVVDTPEGLLISHRDKIEDVRHIAAARGALQ